MVPLCSAAEAMLRGSVFRLFPDFSQKIFSRDHPKSLTFSSFPYLYEPWLYFHIINSHRTDDHYWIQKVNWLPKSLEITFCDNSHTIWYNYFVFHKRNQYLIHPNILKCQSIFKILSRLKRKRIKLSIVCHGMHFGKQPTNTILIPRRGRALPAPKADLWWVNKPSRRNSQNTLGTVHWRLKKHIFVHNFGRCCPIWIEISLQYLG